jgi:hypothetical protein
LREFNEARERDAENQAVVGKEMEKSDNTGWWDLVCWRDHFAEYSIKRIAHVSRMPDRQDKLLKQAIFVGPPLELATVGGSNLQQSSNLQHFLGIT